MVNKLDSLKDTLEGMDTEEEFVSYKAASSDKSAFISKVDDDAVPGTYVIEVTDLADNDVWVEDNSLSDTESLG